MNHTAKLYPIDNPNHLPKEVFKSLGEPLSTKSNSWLTPVGSCLYNLRSKISMGDSGNIVINKNSRCNFEKFENGYLIRINDRQKYFVFPLANGEDWSLEIHKGEEELNVLSLGFKIHLLGVSKKWLKNHWWFKRSFHESKFILKIKTKDLLIELDSNGSNYKAALKYFKIEKRM